MFPVLSPIENASFVGKGLPGTAIHSVTGNGASRGVAPTRRAASLLRTTGCLKNPTSYSLRLTNLPRYAHVRSRQSARSRTATNVGNPGEVFAERINRCGQDGI